MLRFEHPDLLWALAAVPLLAVLFWFLRSRQRTLLSQFVSEGLLPTLAPDLSGAKRGVKNGLLLGGLTCVMLALANPQVGTRLEEVKREGIDLFVALDVSLSMKSEDIRPNRLEKAKRDVSALLSKLRGDRVGLIVFAGDAFVQFPLTSDYSAADLFISAVDVDVVPTPGTFIARAIELALKSFPQDLPTQKAIIIVSDGENTEGDLDAAIRNAVSAGVKVYTVGMGTTAGGPIPIYDAAGNPVDYKRDRNGSIVLTKLEEATLERLAFETNGSYRRATSGGNEIDEIYEELLALERVAFDAKQVTGYESMYQYPLALAVLLLIVEFLLSERRGAVLRLIRRLIPAAAVVVAVLAPQAADAQTHRSLIGEGNDAYGEGKFPDAEVQYKKALEKYPDSRIARYNAGAAYYKQQRYDEAGQTFGEYAASADAPAEASKALYNLGNTLFQSGKLDESIEAYKQTLRLNPRDEDARYNLELARRKKKEQEQQQQQQQQQQQKQQNKQENKDQQDRNQQKDKEQQQQQQPRPDQQQQQQPQEARQDMIPKEQAERILEALRNSEKEIQKQIRKREGTKGRTEKDW